MLDKIHEAVTYIRSRSDIKPQVGIILGSGLGPFADSVEEAVSIPYGAIPHFAKPTVEGHAGRLVLGSVLGVPVAIMQGRFHFYEGHSMAAVTFPTRVLGMLGIHTLVVTNAAGGINKTFSPGDLMVITDHINLMGTNPLIGDNPIELGPRFPDMTHAYHPGCCTIFEMVAKRLGFEVQQGVYAAFTGPSYETPAEIRMLRTVGADGVGMSTVPEVIAGNHSGLRVCGISCITNLAAGITGDKLSHQEVTETANIAMERFINLLRESIPQLVQVQ